VYAGRLVGLTLLASLALAGGLAGAASAVAADPVIAAAGDIACAPTDPLFNAGAGGPNNCAQGRTANIIAAMNPAATAVLPLGDTQYNSGALSAYRASYAPSWGRFLPSTFPVPGNHEYGTAGATSYFDYFLGGGRPAGNRGQGWYSYNIGSWHVIAINSECDKIGVALCMPGGAEEAFVLADLAGHPARCTLAYWHEPAFSSGSAAVTNAQNMLPIWRDLYNAGADLVLTAHKHFYERFAPLNANGQPDTTGRGMTQIITGTGGDDHAGTPPRIAGSLRLNAHTFGVSEITLSSTGWSQRFVGEPGSTFSDSSSGTCH
jgi:acid phosphatase type 7